MFIVETQYIASLRGDPHTPDIPKKPAKGGICPRPRALTIEGQIKSRCDYVNSPKETIGVAGRIRYGRLTIIDVLRGIVVMVGFGAASPPQDSPFSAGCGGYAATACGNKGFWRGRRPLQTSPTKARTSRS